MPRQCTTCFLIYDGPECSHPRSTDLAHRLVNRLMSGGGGEPLPVLAATEAAQTAGAAPVPLMARHVTLLLREVVEHMTITLAYNDRDADAVIAALRLHGQASLADQLADAIYQARQGIRIYGDDE